ncbi:ABC transporter ATP-binding protein [Gordonia jinhuaensis]|uniref:Spermidine/putrescine import ATP-binding protein PotA n=1 Tax=Gordonia jinhuaensis TaxID=1517702 RepID=A0A916T273_9ACTN|nr:ABC transporter ATP-binding protein [Gordonia jinhuaensis]GGB27681.1 polyamine-transporting ATPase [Gordonia jinhuaensis]
MITNDATAPTGTPPGALSLRGIHKSYGEATAVAGIDLDIAAGEFCSLLGASGCGKTTTLRMIAGFERPDAGTITLDGRDITASPPHRRAVNTVFQNYALFPLMTVADNVAFGLKYRRVRGAEARRRVAEALDIVQLRAHADRRPAQLSGGQQQRVALARALVLRPAVLLLDEPMGALDAALRAQLQLELRSLQRSLGTTFVHVTHDQQEALSMSDRVAVMADGVIHQVGTPHEVYTAPATAYVARFIGHASLVEATVLRVDSEHAVCEAFGTLVHARAATGLSAGPATLMIRPEQITLRDRGAPVDADHNRVDAVVTDVVYLGSSSQVHTRTPDGTRLTVEVTNSAAPVSLTTGSPVQCSFTRDAVRLLPDDVAARPQTDAQLAERINRGNSTSSAVSA